MIKHFAASYKNKTKKNSGKKVRRFRIPDWWLTYDNQFVQQEIP